MGASHSILTLEKVSDGTLQQQQAAGGQLPEAVADPILGLGTSQQHPGMDNSDWPMVDDPLPEISRSKPMFLLDGNVLLPIPKDQEDSRTSPWPRENQVVLLPLVVQSTSTLLCPTLAFQEKTFSRRLYRRSCELASNMLTSSFRDPREIQRVFFHTFRYVTPNQVLSIVSSILSSSDIDAVECMRSPDVAQWPRTPMESEQDRGREVAQDKFPSCPAFGPQAKQEIPKLHDRSSYLTPDDVEKVCFQMGYDLTGAGGQVQCLRNCQWNMRRNKLDLDVLSNELLKRAICLGCCPGFKKQDVRLAFWVASK